MGLDDLTHPGPGASIDHSARLGAGLGHIGSPIGGGLPTLANARIYASLETNHTAGSPAAGADGQGSTIGALGATSPKDSDSTAPIGGAILPSHQRDKNQTGTCDGGGATSDGSVNTDSGEESGEDTGSERRGEDGAVAEPQRKPPGGGAGGGSILPSLQGAKVGVFDDGVEANKEESKASPMQAKYEAMLSAVSKTSKQAQLISAQGLLVMAVYMLATFIRDQKPKRR